MTKGENRRFREPFWRLRAGTCPALVHATVESAPTCTKNVHAAQVRNLLTHPIGTRTCANECADEQAAGRAKPCARAQSGNEGEAGGLAAEAFGDRTEARKAALEFFVG